jgi:glycerophosphoryl diester phosphodiesterase
MKHLLLLLLAIAIFPRCASGQAVAVDPPIEHRLDCKSSAGLMQLLRYDGQPLPLVSGHRGGAQPGLPENCLATFENTVRHAFALLEVDPRMTKDGQIVLHHDATLNRTTTGSGRVADFTLAELKQLRLKDTHGKTTEFQIPTLDEALVWARGKAVLVLDQKDVSVAARVKKIEEHKAEGHALLIVYSFQEAKACYELNPNLMMEVMIPNRAKVAEFDQLGVPWRNIVAFVGHVPPEDRGLYEQIHAKGACCMIGTSRNLDRQLVVRQASEPAALESDYRAFLARGADLIDTDLPAPLWPLLYAKTEPPAGKRELFQTRQLRELSPAR